MTRNDIYTVVIGCAILVKVVACAFLIGAFIYFVC